MKPRRPRGGSWARPGVASGCLALALALLLVGSGSGARIKFSERSPQAAYPAGLGLHGRLGVPVARRLAQSRVSCRARSQALGSPQVAYAALVRQKAVIRKDPQGRSAVVGQFGRLNQNGFRVVLGVIGKHSSSHCATDWYRVELPVLPNGLTGWVRAWAVQPFRVRSRITVDVSERRLSVYRAGKLAFQTPVAVGAPATPTPLGHYFVNERYVLPDASGPFGPSALGISAHSDVLKHVWVEDGPIGIHGTNEPSSIGHAQSHGCVRVANDVMRRLFALAPAGTPVLVQA